MRYLHVFESKYHWDARDYEGVNVRVFVRMPEISIETVFIYKKDVTPLGMSEEQFVAFFSDGQDILNNAMEDAAS